MALAYPEGECFFRRDALISEGSYSPHMANHFYGHFLLEVVWNVPYLTGQRAREDLKHPRSKYIKHDLSIHERFHRTNGPYLSAWEMLPIVYGSHYYKGNHRRIQHSLCSYRNRLIQQVNGAALESWFMVIPMPTRKEGWVFIDRLVNIRGIYIPVAQQSSADHPELCTFLHVNFAVADAKIQMLHYHGKPENPTINWEPVAFSKKYGLQDCYDRTIGININGLVNLLSLPRQLRAHNSFTSKNIVIFPMEMISTPKEIQATIWDSKDISWTQVASANFGLEIQWKPGPEKDAWLKNFIINSLTMATGFIPGLGAIGAVAFPLMWRAMFDPDSFMETMRALLPPVDLELKIIEAVLESTKETRAYLPDGWDSSFAGPGFLRPHPAGTVKAAALLAESPTDGQIDTERLINNELKALAGISYDDIQKIVDSGRPEDQIVVLEVDVEGKDDPPASDTRLDDELEVQGAPDLVTLDEVGPNMSFRLAEQVLKDTAVPQEESEWKKLVEDAVDSLHEIFPLLPDPSEWLAKTNADDNEVKERVDETTGPKYDYNSVDKYLRDLFAGKIDLEE